MDPYSADTPYICSCPSIISPVAINSNDKNFIEHSALIHRILDWQASTNNDNDDDDDSLILLNSNTSCLPATRKRKMGDTPPSQRPPRSASPKKRRRNASSSEADVHGDNDDDNNDNSCPTPAAETPDATFSSISHTISMPMSEGGTNAFPIVSPASSPELSQHYRLPDRRAQAHSSQFSQPTQSRATQSRTSSPSKGGNRQKRIALEFTTPNFFSGLPDCDDDDTDDNTESAPAQIPASIATLVHDLSETRNTLHCVPSALKAWIQKYSHGTECIPDEAYDDTSSANSPTPHLVRDIYEDARRVYRAHSDEQAWYPVIRLVLSTICEHRSASFLEVDNSQSKSVCQELLPLSGTTPISTVKTDFLLQLNRNHKGIGSLLNPVFKQQPNLSLSAFNDPNTSKTFTAAIIEVKAPGGDFDEGVYQFSVASAGVFARLRTLFSTFATNPIPMPVIGWVIHGHFWYLHVAYVQADSSIRVLGPMPSGNTSTLLGIFRLLRILQVVKDWVKDVYWPFLRDLSGELLQRQ